MAVVANIIKKNQLAIRATASDHHWALPTTFWPHSRANTCHIIYLRASSLVRFYKSKFFFWNKRELFNKFVNQISEQFVNPEIFCCQPFKNEGQLAVLLLFSKFSASFSLIWQFPGTKSGGKLAVLLLFSNFLCLLSRISANVRNSSQKYFRN